MPSASEPPAIEIDYGALRIRIWKTCLLKVSALAAMASQTEAAGARSPGRVSDGCGKIPDQEDHGVARDPGNVSSCAAALHGQDANRAPWDADSHLYLEGNPGANGFLKLLNRRFFRDDFDGALAQVFKLLLGHSS